MGDITIPTGISTKNITEELKGKIADGTYGIGSLIIPQRFEKTVLQNGKIYRLECFRYIWEVNVSGKTFRLNS